MKFENRIKKLREIKGWSQAELAEKSKLTPSAISQYESGGREPGLKSLINISNAFGLTIDGLINKDIKTPRKFEFEASVNSVIDNEIYLHILNKKLIFKQDGAKYNIQMTELLDESK